MVAGGERDFDFGFGWLFFFMMAFFIALGTMNAVYNWRVLDAIEANCAPIAEVQAVKEALK